MEGGNGGGGSCWSYRGETGSGLSTVSSSRSVTIVSTAYTSSASCHSSTVSAEKAAMLFDLEVDGDEDVPREDAEDIRSLVEEFFVEEFLVGAPSAADCSTNGGDMSVLERWFRELGVGWVLHLHLTDGASAGILQHTSADAQIWIRALGKIVKTFRSSALEEEAESKNCNNLDQFQFARFLKETMLKMVAFVDVIVHLDGNTITCENLMANGARALYQKISILLLVHNALSKALSQIKVSFLSPANTETGRIRDEMLILLYAKDAKACEVICSTLDQISTRIMELMEDMSVNITPQGSSDVHKVTRSAMDLITFLLDNRSTLVSILLEDHSVWTRHDTLDSMILKMVSSLEQKLVSLSKSFSDQGLRFLFLLNNSYFMLERLQHSHLQEFGFIHLTFEVNDYMDSYLYVSWAPVLSCLLDPTPLCFHKNYSSLSKFESEFQKTYTTHKMWKVPNPELRQKPAHSYNRENRSTLHKIYRG